MAYARANSAPRDDGVETPTPPPTTRTPSNRDHSGALARPCTRGKGSEMARTKPTAAQIEAAAVAARDRAIINQILNGDGGSISSLSQTAPPRPASEILCRYGAACYRPDCKFKHPTAYVAQAPACRDGWHCTRPGCGFTHPPGVRDRIELPLGLRDVLMDRGGRILQEIRRRVRDARIQIATDTVDVEAASAGALEHVLEYMAWTRHAVVSRGCKMDKMPGLGLVVAVLQKEKRQETGRKLTKGEKKACKRAAGAYMTPPVEPRFLDPLEWDRFVAPRAPRPPTETKMRPKRKDERYAAIASRVRAAVASRKRGRDDDDDYGSAGEETRRQRGLETPIDASNKGYRMLQKMGYDGGGLGKDGAGMVEPLGTEMRKTPQLLARDESRSREARARRRRRQPAAFVRARSDDDSRSRSRSRSRDDASSYDGGAYYDSYDSYEAYDSEGSCDSGDRICGFSPGDVEELMCQGVKPWDDDAHDVLAALYY